MPGPAGPFNASNGWMGIPGRAKTRAAALTRSGRRAFRRELPAAQTRECAFEEACACRRSPRGGKLVLLTFELLQELSVRSPWLNTRNCCALTHFAVGRYEFAS